MFYDNAFSRDSVTQRGNRLLMVESNLATHAVALGIPAAMTTWGATCNTAFLASRQTMALETNEVQEASTLLAERLSFMESEYQVARLFAYELYADAMFRIEKFAFDEPMPRSQDGRIEKVEKVLSAHARMIADGDTPVFPPALVTRLENAVAAARTAFNERALEQEDATDANREYADLWNNDTKMLKALYSYAVLIWGDNDPRLNGLGFAMKDQMGQGGGTTPPEPVSDLVLLNGILSWAAVDNATSYRVAITPDADQANWTEIYSGSDTQVPVPEPLTGGIHCRVEARNAGGYSQPIIITKVFALDTPQDFNFISGNFVCNSVDWANGYHLEESDNQTEWNLIWNQNTTSIPHTVKSGVWHYRLRAGYGSVYSAYTPTLTLDSNNFGG